MTPQAPPLIDRIVAGLARQGRPRSTADLAREYLGTGLLDEAVAERLLGPGLAADPRLARTPAGWEVRDQAARAYRTGLSFGEPHVACLAPRDRPAVALAGNPGDALYTVACGGEPEARRAEERSGRHLPRPVVDLVRCARRLRGYRGPPDSSLLAEALRAGHLDPVSGDAEEDASAHARVVLAAWDHLCAGLALEGVTDLEALEQLLDERLEAAEFTGRGFGPADIEALPAAPGVYLFRDAGGRALYVGQSGSLVARVTSYFSGPPRDEKDRTLRAQADALITRPVESGPDALLLEARWIRRHRPRLNTRLAVRAAATEDGILALRGGEEGRRIVLFVLRGPGLALRVSSADSPLRRTRGARRAVDALFAEHAPGSDRAAGALVDFWRQAHPGELFLRPAVDGGPEQILERLLRL